MSEAFNAERLTRLCDFLQQSPTPWHATQSMTERLEQAILLGTVGSSYSYAFGGNDGGDDGGIEVELAYEDDLRLAAKAEVKREEEETVGGLSA